MRVTRPLLAAARVEVRHVRTVRLVDRRLLFAPDDAAFAKVPTEALNALLADKAKLAKVLTYHVVNGEVLAKKVVKLKSAKTLEGSSVAIKEADGKVMVGDANVTATDIKCSNGVIHVIDKVMLPSS